MTRSKILMTGTAVVALLGIAAVGAWSVVGQAAAAPDVQPAVAKLDDFRLATADLDSYDLYRMKDAAAVVLLTQQNGCGASQSAAEVLHQLKAKYGAKGVEFLMLNSTNDRDSVVAEEKKLGGGDIPVLMDADQLVGEGLNVSQAGEAIVVNPKTMQVVYRGALDAGTGSKVLDGLIAGSPAYVAAKAVKGCPINFPNRAHKADYTKISYAKEIAPIIEDKCVACHQKGSIGPMELTSYEKVKGFAPMIRETIRTQRMPPWQAEPGIGHFLNDKSLSPEQIKTLVHWIEAGAPRGDGADPLAAVQHVAQEWPLGKPDLVLDLPAYTVPASGIVDYQHPWTANPLTEGRWIRASTIKPGSRQAVHHILTGYLDTVPQTSSVTEAMWGSSVGTYAVGAESDISPPDVGVYFPAGGAVGFQNHYTPYGKQDTDKSQIALYFYPKDKTPSMVMHNIAITQPNIQIAPNQERYKDSAYLTFPKDAILYSAFFHAHYRGSSAKMEVQYPDGTREILAALPRYDFNWQREYDFAQPVKLPAGSKLITTYTFDNSKRNPANPDSNRTVPWGEQSFDEMLYTQLRYRWTDETSKKLVSYDKLLGAGRLMGALDANLDNKIERAELRGPMGKALEGKFDALDTNHDGALDATELAAASTQAGHRGDH
jgi:hypothetical protein